MFRQNDPTRIFGTTKQRIVDAAKADSEHRLAILTIGREIENDIRIQILQLSLAEIFEDSYVFDGLNLSGYKCYPVEISTSLKVTGEQKEKVERKVSNKVNLSRKVVDEYHQRKIERKDVPSQPPYIEF